MSRAPARRRTPAAPRARKPPAGAGPDAPLGPDDILERAGAAMLKLAAERPWREVSLRAIAAEAGTPLPALYERAPSALHLLAWLSGRFDRAALTAEAESEDPHDRLFEAVMARVEAMEPHRAALTAIIGAENPLALAPHLPRTARAILEGAGIPATPARWAAMSALWTRIVQVWRDDGGALNRTMAEIDKRLRQFRSLMRRLGEGF
ncbi:MAG TPA: TetR family transcriptional regulator [Caulobacteraceae bacterium]|nr:TetR family transcriptional regulator [Caulobacteraceae bacterium]